MRKKDAVSNVFFRDPERVADLLNGYGPKCLKEMLMIEKCPLELQQFIVDYPLHLLDVRR